MGSNCIIKMCRNRPTQKGNSFHRLKCRLKNSGCSLENIFPPGTFRQLTSTSRICSEHFRLLPMAVQNAIGAPAEAEKIGHRAVGCVKRTSELLPEQNGYLDLINQMKWRQHMYATYFRFKHLRSLIELQWAGTMIADPVAGSTDSAMASGSGEAKVEALKEEGEGGEARPSPSPAPANGLPMEEEEEEEDRPTPAKEDEEDGHISSEDEDKLVINEVCEKKKEGGSTEDRGSVPQSEHSEASSPKSPLKRPAEDGDASADLRSKKSRVLPAAAADEGAADLAQIDESLDLLKGDIHALHLMMVQKEEEWNALLKLSKKKEELYLRLSKKKQLLKAKEIGTGAETEEEDCNVVFLPQGAYSSLGTSQFPYMMLKHMLGDSYMPQVVPSKGGGRDGSSANGPVHSPGNVSVIDIHTSHSNPSTGGAAIEPPQISISPDTHSKLGKQLNNLMSMKPILPKPMTSSGPMIRGGLSALPYPSGGYGPQGPTVSVQHLIEAHRNSNPNIPPIRGAKRGAWRHRFEGSEKRSCSREPDRPSSVSSSSSETDIRVSAKSSPPILAQSTAAGSLLTMADPSISYKDVLLQFAQLTQSEKQPGSPQISIIPVSSGEPSLRKSEPYPDSTSISREMPASSQNSSHSNVENSSALAKLLLESRGNNHSHVTKPPTVDLSFSNDSPHNLTLSALLSGGTTTTMKEKAASLGTQRKPFDAITLPRRQVDVRSKKAASGEEGGNSNPKCQGCHKNRAQFVCAGCGNQWYCSRPCQITAWERHSEHCNS